MQVAKFCYSMMHNDILNHKTHESQLRQPSPRYHSLVSAVTWENSMQPHYTGVIPGDSSGSITQGLWQVSEFSTRQITKLITKELWFALQLCSSSFTEKLINI